MSDTIPTPIEAEAHLEQAHATTGEAQVALDAVTAATGAAKAEAAHLESLDALTPDDLLAVENVRRRLRILDAEYVAATAAHVAALATLAEAEREAHRAQIPVAAQVVETKGAAVEKEITKGADRLRAVLAPLLDATQVVEAEAAAAGEYPPSLPDLIALDTSTDEALFTSLGAMLRARREAAESAARTAALDAERDRQEAEREAARAAWEAMSYGEKVEHFERRVEQFKGIHPGYQDDAARRYVARCIGEPFAPWAGFNPHEQATAPAPEPVPFDEARELDAIAQRHHEAQAAARPSARRAAGMTRSARTACLDRKWSMRDFD